MQVWLWLLFSVRYILVIQERGDLYKNSVTEWTLLLLEVLMIPHAIWVVIPKASYEAGLQPFLWVNLQLSRLSGRRGKGRCCKGLVAGWGGEEPEVLGRWKCWDWWLDSQVRRYWPLETWALLTSCLCTWLKRPCSITHVCEGAST